MIHTQDLINEIKTWLDQEKTLGSPNPHNIVLATAGKNGIPHSRIVAIRDISEQGVLFFTQRGTKKVTQILENPHASMTLWLPLQQRQIIMDGVLKALTPEENEHSWNLLPYDRRIRFSTYAPTSGQPIQDLSILETKAKTLTQQYTAETLPISPYYCGYRLVPEAFYFYTLGTLTFSEVIKYTFDKGSWHKERLSP